MWEGLHWWQKVYHKVDADYKLQDLKKPYKELEMKGKGYKGRLDDLHIAFLKHMEQYASIYRCISDCGVGRACWKRESNLDLGNPFRGALSRKKGELGWGDPLHVSCQSIVLCVNLKGFSARYWRGFERCAAAIAECY
ncbi:uncharacterized protein LOC130772975 [Actinidia eriantha]|uniref:uncharacterized protein LOC130772975 n=1 Tax=Actinidia eriantha TaxID=165200 RepID=UPI00258FEAC7|nr:uncharacterized protein LOC130772975 [Actinidia eriantha]